jgi:SPASM domain peptide maturase of grasp-with-spasm system
MTPVLETVYGMATVHFLFPHLHFRYQNYQPMVSSSKKFVLLFASCIATRGISQSIICDTERCTIHTIPNDMYDIIMLFRSHTLAKLYDIYDNVALDQYMSFLYQNEYIFFTDEPELFPDISEEYAVPCHIHNSIVCVSSTTEPYLIQIIKELTTLCCQFLELRVYDCSSDAILSELLKEISRSSIINVAIYYNGQIDRKKSYLYELIENNKVIEYIIVYDCRKSNEEKLHKRIIYIDEVIQDKCCGIINSSFFSPNLATINLSKNFNSCLYKKISVDVDGYIKSCPSMSLDYGNISNSTLISTVDNTEYQYLWGIKKNNVLICKNCEYRLVCTDCRAYIENPEDVYSKPLKCGYNPVTREWSDWVKVPEKLAAIQHFNIFNM